MKHLAKILFLIGSVTSSLAQAQSITWTGAATGGNEPFSMAEWMYSTMAEVASDPSIPTYGTEPNDLGGYNVTYTGEGTNHIACSSEHINFPNGLWICQMSNGIITDGALARKLVSYLLTGRSGPTSPTQVNTGTFQGSIDSQHVEYTMKYNDSSIQSVNCHYKKAGDVISWATCIFK